MSDSAVLFSLRLRLLRNILRTVREHSRLKIAVVSGFGLAVLLGLSYLFYRWFIFMNTRAFRDIRPVLDEYLFSLFFLTLLVMLIFSTAIISFASLFRARETEFLLSHPLGTGAIFAHKFTEAAAFSSWAFLVLGIPLFGAYGVTNNVPWYFFPGLVLFFAVFVPIPACMGVCVTMLLAVYFPRQRARVLVLAISVVGAALAFLGFRIARLLRAVDLDLGEIWLRKILATLSFSQSPWLPSRWVGQGVAALARAEIGEAVFFFLLLLSTSLFLAMLCMELAESHLRRGWSICQATGERRRYPLGTRLDRALDAVTRLLRPDVRLFVKKDIKTFIRDPVQWSQVLIFVGLLGVYILNLRNLGHDTMDLGWRNIISFLNLTATALTIATYTGRFVFPMLSLEGKRFWVLGLLPVERRSILMGKFYFSAGGALIISETLMVVSDFMLRLPLGFVFLHALLVAMLCVGLSAIAVGLGAAFPNLKEDDPSKIVAGFGGTLNLMLSLVFVALVIGFVAAPCHLYFARGWISIETFKMWLAISIIAATLVSIVACVLPLRLGLRTFNRMEF